MSFFSRSISHRVLAVFSMVGALVLGAVTIGHSGISASLDELRRVAAQDMHHERLVSGMVSGFKKQVQEWKNVLLRGADPQQLNKYWGKFQKQEKQIQESGRNLLAGMSPSDARDLVDDFLRAHREMGVAYRAGFEAFVNAGLDPTVGDKAVKGIDRAPTKLLEDAAAQIAGIAHKASDTALDGASSTSLTALFATLATLLAGVGASAFFLRRFLLKPMCRVVSGLEKLADGDFKVDIDLRRQDELGQLARSARRIREDLGGVLQKIVATAHELDLSGKSLAELSEHNRVQLDAQQGGTSQVATAMDQLVAAAREVAGGAAGAAHAATNVEGSTASGAQVVGQAIASINHLEQDVEKVHQELTALEGHSDAIGNVLDVIRGIAEQTNLLALNAAIEAARAGEQGRGFAVVADEVRSLAKRTQESTQEIQQTIEQLQDGARAAVASMEHGRTRVDEGVARTREVEHALKEITAAVTTIVETNTQIATAAAEQGEVAGTVSDNVARIDGSSSKMVASAESVAQTSRNIADLASSLREATSRFRF